MFLTGDDGVRARAHVRPCASRPGWLCLSSPPTGSHDTLPPDSQEKGGSSMVQKAGKVSKVGAKVGKIVRLVRLIRCASEAARALLPLAALSPHYGEPLLLKLNGARSLRAARASRCHGQNFEGVP